MGPNLLLNSTAETMQITKIKFSVVIPTCDRPLLLKEALQSVFSQSLPPYEILIIDNGEKSVDAEPLEGGKRVRYVRALPKFGVSQARNMGICLAKGDYIAFLDDDDIWDKNYLKEVANVIDKTMASVVFGSVKALETGKVIPLWSQPIKPPHDFKRQLLKMDPVGTLGGTIVAKRELLFSSSGFDPVLPPTEDRALVLDLLLNCNPKFVKAENAFMYYRTNVKGGRLTDQGTLLRGRIRFLLKYWKIMDFSTRLHALIKCLKLGIKNAIGIDYVRRRDEKI